MLYEECGELKYKYRSREFWCRGYYVDTAGKNAERIAEYIKYQLAEDRFWKWIPGNPYKRGFVPLLYTSFELIQLTGKWKNTIGI